MSTREWLMLADRLWPSWPGERKRRWIRHARYASRCVPSYARLLPLTDAQMPPPREQIFAARTMRECAL